ncbi:MAG TPA: isoprenylcysteine carboxylmethyltransferase family protein [Verrucomicrobiae bacterium]|jgi:protein-S-isoprenylcysteine O-methyltransferase Ste14|nr:isoprenylcysteine carboxylmethyltransferase family protein [Verrucomicrobiae bacterium]
MRGIPSALFSATAYALFLATFLYAIGFVENVLVPKSIDTGAAEALATAVAINLALLGVFALQHTIMARPRFKRALTRFVPTAIERSIFVTAASLALVLVMWQWRPIPALIWSVETPALAASITALSWAGWGLVLASTFLISHFHLFGLSQGFARVLNLAPDVSDQKLVTPLFYRWVRHPLYAGFIIAFWAAPHMSLGHLLFASATSGYILIGIWFEERDLVAHFGARYETYRAQVGMLFPKLFSDSKKGRAHVQPHR